MRDTNATSTLFKTLGRTTNEITKNDNFGDIVQSDLISKLLILNYLLKYFYYLKSNTYL